MRPNGRMLFGNIFDDVKITPNYLGRFGDDVVAKLTQNNVGTTLDIVLNPLKAAMIPFRAELGQVDTTINLLVGKTATVDSFIEGFTLFMRDNYINIAAKLGGEKTASFIEFYPHGKNEYNHITKTEMPTVMDRLKTAATTHTAELGATLTGQLQGFQIAWATLRDNQLKGKAAVKTNRAERTTARKAVEVCLLKTIYFIADKHPGDVKQCKVFFNFDLLFGVTHNTGAEGIATENGHPKADVSISVVDTNKVVATNAQGYFRIVPIADGTVTMEASTESGKVVSKQVTITAGHVETVNFEL